VRGGASASKRPRKYALLRERWRPDAMAALDDDAAWDKAWKAGAALSIDTHWQLPTRWQARCVG